MTIPLAGWSDTSFELNGIASTERLSADQYNRLRSFRKGELSKLLEWVRKANPGPGPVSAGVPDCPAPHVSSAGISKHVPHSDGLEAGCWLWWKDERHDIPKGVVYRLLDYTWGRESVLYDNLEGSVFEDAIQPGTMRGRISEANKVLRKIGIPWKLTADSVNRVLRKILTATPLS